MAREMIDNRNHLLHASIEAASAPVVKASAAGSSIVLWFDWISSGPGLIAVLGLLFTAGTFLLNAWSIWRRDRREQEAHEQRMRQIAGEVHHEL